MIDVTKCIGCRKGIYPFIKNGDKNYSHLDFFATAEAGAIYSCENSDVVGEFLVDYPEDGKSLPTKSFLDFLDRQSDWWEDMVTLANDILEDPEEVLTFFNENGLWNKSNEEIEKALVKLASSKEFLIHEEDYPNLKYI